MKYLFLFLKKQSFFFLFVFLELIAFLLLANHNNYQKTQIINSANVITGSFNTVSSTINDYFFLNEANYQLSLENAQLNNARFNILPLPDSIFKPDTLYTFIPARVVSNTSRNRNNYIMINKGRADGVEKEMGLISPLGVAGIVVEVSAHYASAMSLLHKNARISARLKNNGQMVNVSWMATTTGRVCWKIFPHTLYPNLAIPLLQAVFHLYFPKT